MILPNDITNLKTDITDKIGQKIIVKGTLGRSRFFEKEATIEKTYPEIFIVTNFLLSVIAIFSATINGSIKSIKILPGDDAKFAPAAIITSKKLWHAPANIANLLLDGYILLASITAFAKYFEFL